MKKNSNLNSFRGQIMNELKMYDEAKIVWLQLKTANSISRRYTNCEEKCFFGRKNLKNCVSCGP